MKQVLIAGSERKNPPSACGNKTFYKSIKPGGRYIVHHLYPLHAAEERISLDEKCPIVHSGHLPGYDVHGNVSI